MPIPPAASSPNDTSVDTSLDTDISLGGNHHPHDVIAFIRAKQTRSLACALLVITDIVGGTLRSKGALMAVCADGETCGYISNGCVDSDIIIHARESLAQGRGKGQVRHIHYGEGSPYLDISLSCGGYIKILILPNPAASEICKIHGHFQNRTPLHISYSTCGHLTHSIVPKPDKEEDIYQFHYPPKIKLNIAGRGAVAQRLAVLAARSGFETVLLSIGSSLAGWAKRNDIAYLPLSHPDHPPPLSEDKWTATALMFHDHEWEQALLQGILKSDGFYIGALGSKKTHAIRCDALRAAGVADEQIDRIHGPIGTVSGQRDANLIALSTLAQILEQAQQTGRLS